MQPRRWCACTARPSSPSAPTVPLPSAVRQHRPVWALPKRPAGQTVVNVILINGLKQPNADGRRLTHYYCDVCKFHDDDNTKNIYHCPDCKICRIGKGIGIDRYHCQKCNICAPSSLPAAYVVRCVWVSVTHELTLALSTSHLQVCR